MTALDGPARLPGMQDVARLAGVSHQTVSRVLNAHPNVRPETKTRVLQAISELGYRRNTAARALVTRRSETIGVVTINTALFGPTSTLLSVEAAARQAGYFVSVASLSIADAAHMTRTLEHFMAQAVEGVVVIAPQVSVAKAAELIGAVVPVVLVASDVPKSAGYQSVSVDQQGGARLAVGHLIDLGHRDIAHLAGPIEFYDGRARVRGWRHEMKVAGLPVREPLVGDWSPDSGYELGRQLIKRGVPDAVFAANDQMALGLMQALGEAGLSVPEDLSIVGFDDIEGSAFFRPPLSTVRQDFAGLGRLCMTTMIAALEGRPAAKAVPIPAQLVVRASTASRSRAGDTGTSTEAPIKKPR
jgi:DNA-binding LacI/PurR family transcriptional regulator